MLEPDGLKENQEKDSMIILNKIININKSHISISLLKYGSF